MDGTSVSGVQAEVHKPWSGPRPAASPSSGAPTDVYLQVAANLTPDLRLGRRPQPPVGAAKMPLGTIATVTPTRYQARISRVDQSPAATISADSDEQGHRRSLDRDPDGDRQARRPTASLPA